MPYDDNDLIKLRINPWPEFISASYRYFFKNEKHITRICDFYVLIFVLERSLLFWEDKTEVILKKGEWYIQKPGLFQQAKKGSPSPVYFYVHFQAKETLHPNIPSHDLNQNENGVILKKRGTYDIRLLKPLFDQLDYCYKNRAYDIINSQALFLSILNMVTFSHHTADNSGLAGEITRYISENYGRDITCGLLAERFHFSTEYINRTVKKYCGQTPVKYLQQIRIARAMELLANTDHTLSFIAGEVGYHDTTVFYKAFKKLTGMAPGNWRDQSRGIIKKK